MDSEPIPKAVITKGADCLPGFFAAIREDGRISSTHIGIYAALVEYARRQGAANPFCAFSRDIMPIAKISAPATYHKCIRELDEYGYIRYDPSFDRCRGSRIYLKEWG